MHSAGTGKQRENVPKASGTRSQLKTNRRHESLRKGQFMNDPAESLRRKRLSEINAEASSREDLEAQYGQVWTTQELQNEFTVEGFLAPFVVVRRKADGQRGTLEFQHQPRLYFNFREDEG